MRLKFGHFLLDVEVERTRAYYETGQDIGCDCPGCRNYVQAAEAFPAELQSFFRTLGIDPKKPAEVYVRYTNEDGTLSYGGFYHLCGTLVQGQGGWRMYASTETGQISTWEQESCYPAADRYLVAFSEGAALLEEGFPTPVLQMEIDASLPWMLEEENDYP